MDRATLREAVGLLETQSSALTGQPYAPDQAVRQFNALLEEAKSLYQERVDIQALQVLGGASSVTFLILGEVLVDSVRRLGSALDLRPPGSAAEVLAGLRLPSDASEDLLLDLQELEEAVNLGLAKTVLLLSGFITEALLLSRHPNNSTRGPGLQQMVEQAKQERLFGRDTLRELENLVDYRDVIHPRAEHRNQTFRNEARIDTALTALKLLLHELEDTDVRYGQ